MNYIKSLRLLAAAAAALMAFAGTASATTITSSTGSTPTFKAVNEGAVELGGHSGEFVCTGSTMEGNIESHGAGISASGKLMKLTFTECDAHVTVGKPGSLSITKSSTTGNGTLTSSGAELTAIMTTIFGNVHCIWATNQTHIGTLTGTSSGRATLDIQAKIPRVATSALCGSEPAEWVGRYQVDHPTALQVH